MTGGGSELNAYGNAARILANQSCRRGREDRFCMEAVRSESWKCDRSC